MALKKVEVNEESPNWSQKAIRTAYYRKKQTQNLEMRQKTEQNYCNVRKTTFSQHVNLLHEQQMKQSEQLKVFKNSNE